MSRTLLPLAGLVLFLSPDLGTAADLVVDPLGGGDHLTIQAAVDAAAPDDLILVEAGTYAGSVVVDGKPLWIAAFDGVQVTIAGTLEVRNLAAGEVFVAIGIDALPPDSTDPYAAALPALRLLDNLGEVRIHDGTFVGARGKCESDELDGCLTAGAAGAPGAFIQNCARIALVTCTFRGGVGGSSGIAGEGAAPSGHGAHEITSAVGAWACDFIGGAGRSHYGYGGRGGDGFHSQTFGVFGARCRFEGGNGGNNHDFLNPIGGNGGDGLFVSAGSQARATADCTMIPGAPGVPTCGICGGGPGMAGMATRGPGPVVAIAGSGRTITGPAVIRDGSAPTWVVHGAPGDVHYFRAAPRPSYRWVPWRRGFDLADVPYMDRAAMGTVPGSGSFTTSYPATRLGGSVGLSSRRLFGQSFVHAGDGGIVLGAPHDVVLLGP